MSDLLHFGNVSYLAARIEQAMDKQLSIENLTSVVRLLDSMMASDQGITQLSKLIRSLESLLRKNDNINMLSLSQIVRLLKVFAYSSEVNLSKHPIIERLVKVVD